MTLPSTQDILRWMPRDTILSRAGLKPPGFLFRRWADPIRAGFLGLAPDYAKALEQGLLALSALTGHPVEIVPIDRANLHFVGLSSWSDLALDPALARAYPGIRRRKDVILAKGFAQMREIRTFGRRGIRRFNAVYDFSKPSLAAAPPARFGLSQACLVFLFWEGVWKDGQMVVQSPTDAGDLAALRPGIAATLKAAYHPSLPNYSRDPAIADQISAIADAQAS